MKKIVYVGNVPLGDGKVYIQSMTNTDTCDVVATAAQVNALAKAGAAIVRVSVPTKESAEALKEIVRLSTVPIVADVHFSAEPAIVAVRNGAKKIRVNPLNMTGDDIKRVVTCCKEYGVPIRVGVNAGSSKRHLSPEALVTGVLDCAARIEDFGYDKLVLAVKSSDVAETVAAYRLLKEKTEYPLHVGLTEAGTAEYGTIKSAVAIGSLLLDGIGDTIRVSLAGDPVREVYAAKKILRACGLDKNHAEVVACPTCARTCIDVEALAKRVEEATADLDFPVKIAVMGCVVNGVGESANADFGVAGGKEKSVLIRDGETYKTVLNEDVERELLKLIDERKHG